MVGPVSGALDMAAIYKAALMGSDISNVVETRFRARQQNFRRDDLPIDLLFPSRAWTKRLPVILKQLKAPEPASIIGGQECTSRMRPQVAAGLGENWSWVVGKNAGGTETNVPIFYDGLKWDVIEGSLQWLILPSGLRKRYATFAKFMSRSTGGWVWICSAHLASGGIDEPKEVQLRDKQIQMIYDYIRTLDDPDRIAILRRGRGWVIGGWFCPVVNLWFPKQIDQNFAVGVRAAVADRLGRERDPAPADRAAVADQHREGGAVAQNHPCGTPVRRQTTRLLMGGKTRAYGTQRRVDSPMHAVVGRLEEHVGLHTTGADPPAPGKTWRDGTSRCRAKRTVCGSECGCLVDQFGLRGVATYFT